MGAPTANAGSLTLPAVMVHLLSNGPAGNLVLVVGGIALILLCASIYEIGWGFYRRLGKKRDALLQQPESLIRKCALNSTAHRRSPGTDLPRANQLHTQVRKSEQIH